MKNCFLSSFAFGVVYVYLPVAIDLRDLRAEERSKVQVFEETGALREPRILS